MNKIKKLFIFALLITFTFLFIKTQDVKANTNTVYSDNNKASWTLTDETVTKMNGMTHTIAHGYSNENIPTNAQQINVFSMKTDGAYSKIVNWGIQSGNSGYRRAALADIAKDYEENHPGWIVLGGINADQYAMTEDYGGSNVPVYPQPYYPVIIDGERKFVTGLFGTTTNFVGLSNKGEDNPFVYESGIDGYYLYIYNENDVFLDKIKIEGLNKEATSTGTTVWMAYKKLHSDITGTHVTPTVSGENLYVVENAELAYISQAPEYRGLDFAGFGRGIISKEAKTHTVTEGQIVVQTNDEKVISYISETSANIKIVVQADYTNADLNNIECSAGFHSAQRINNQDVETTATYDTQSYSRSIFGRKADGTYALVTIDLKSLQYKGTSQDESNAILKSYGIVEAYQQDGGGSVTAVLRNELGSFDTVNTVKEGSVRTIFNGLFFVVRDPGFKVYPAYNTRNSIKVMLEENENTKFIKNIKVTVDGKTVDMVENEAIVEGLKEDTEYEVIYTFDMLNEETNEYQTVSYSTKTKTKAFKMPSAGFKFSLVNKTSVTLTRGKGSAASWFENIKVTINGETYNMGTDYELKIDNLIQDTKYDAEISYDVVEPDTGNIYHGTETKTVTTLAYALPEIVKFEIYRQSANRITFSYEYKDEDGVVEYANIKCNGKATALTSKRGTVSISDLDFENNEYTFQLQVAYDPGSDYLEQVLSEKIVVGKNVEIPVEVKHSITYNLDGGTIVDAPNEYTEGIGIEVLPTPTKEGYNFLGWYIGSKKVESISTDAKEDITLVAKWEEIEVTKEHEHVACPTCGLCISSECDGDTSVKCPGHTETPKEEKKGCGCSKSASYFIVFSAILGVALILFRKRK